MKTKSKLEEKKLSKAELEAREKVMKDLKKNKSALVKRYGKDAEAVMYGRATNIAKKMAESENKNHLKELVRKSLMKEQDIEVGADRYEGEKELGQASVMMDELESLLKGFDWWYYMSDDPRVFNKWGAIDNQISKLEKELTAMGYGEDVKKLHNQYATDDKHKIKEGKKEDVDGDGDIDSKDYLAKRDAAIKKAKGEMKEDIDLGHEDNEPHMIKAELYRVGKYAMELYAILEELEETGGEYDFPGWWQSKITTAMNNMVSAKHYLDFELKEPAIDAAVDALTGEEPHMGEPEPPMMEDIFSGRNDMISSDLEDNDDMRVDRLAAKLYKLKTHIQPGFYQKLRSLINSGDLEKAEFYLDRIQDYGDRKDTEFAAMKSKLNDLDEGFLDRIKANVKGTVATVGQAAKNVGAAVSGNLDQVKSVTMSKGLAKLGQKTKTLGKELDDVINDIDKLFSPKDLQNPQLRNLLDKYVANLKQTKQFSQSLASGNYEVTSSPDSEVKPKTQPTPATPASPAKTTPAAPASPAKTTPARDEKGRFVSNKPTTDTKTAAAPTNVKPISNNYTVTKDTYSYKGKNYPVQIDKTTKEKFFKHEDGRIMDIAAIEKNSQIKKKTTGVAEKIAEKLTKQLKSK